MRASAAHWVLGGSGLVLWLALIGLPLGSLYVEAARTAPAGEAAWSAGRMARLAASSAGLAAAVAALSVLLAWVPGRLLGAADRHRVLLLGLLLAPLLLPRYVLYYAWSLLMAPTTGVGAFLAVQPLWVARGIGTATSALVLTLWYWPLAALVLSQGWRHLDRDVLESAAMESGPWRRFTGVLLPLMARPMGLAFAVGFVLVLSEYGTFHLAGVETIGSALGVLYEQTGSASAVARGAAPLVGVAAVVAALLGRGLASASTGAAVAAPAVRTRRPEWVLLGVLVAVSVGVPVALMAASVSDLAAFEQFWRLQRDGLATSLVAAVAASGAALVMAGGVLAAQRWPAPGRAVAWIMQAGLLVAMFVPGSLVGVALLEAPAAFGLPPGAGEGWWALSAGQAARFAGVALVVLRLSRDPADRHFREMADVDGAGTLEAWRYVGWPRHWPLVVGAGVLVVLFSLTEVPATMVLLAPGLPNFTQRLLNQMHYARDQHVIASCLALVAAYLAVAAGIGILARLGTRRAALAPVLLAAAVALAGCEPPSGDGAGPRVLRIIGASGRGPGEFLYPRAIALDAAGAVYVADRTGRIQRFSPDGDLLGLIALPDTEKGYPVGMSVGPDGNLYVADTHYHRVLVYGPQGRLVRSFGEFGTGDGRFIYPTDVAFAGGRVLVSEYGGNDRVSVFSAEGEYVGSFGRPGSGEGEFSRPAALCVDGPRGVLYVADACNHRVARYTLEGTLIGYLGAAGTGPGQLRYPYGLALGPGGSLIVCEYGNNRVQWFDAEGRSVKRAGGPGRRPGQLAYPWGVAAGADGRVYVVDAGNNRVQVWAP